MNVRFSKPALILRPYIERYWSWDYESDVATYMPTLIPGVGMDFFLHYKTPFTTLQHGRLQESHLFFSHERPVNILPTDSVGFIVIRFRAGMLKHFCAMPLSELSGICPGAAALWGNNGSCMQQRVNSAENFESKVLLLDEFLEMQLNIHKNEASLWDHVVDDLYHHKDPIRADLLAKQMHLSYRHFRRRFIEETGIAPKHFQQLVRFRSTLRPLLMKEKSKYLSLALDNGYFDQMHFIKEFKRFLQATPTDFLQEKNFMSHFYYPSL